MHSHLGSTLMRKYLLSLLAAGIALLGLAGATPASADAPPLPLPLILQVDKTTAHPGDSVTLTLTMVNTESTPIVFGYQYMQPGWPGNQWNDDLVKYAFTSCTGDQSTCVTTGHTAWFHWAAPVAPGDHEVVRLTYTIAPDSYCNPGLYIDWSPYLYYEFDGGTRSASHGLPGGQTQAGGTWITCED